MSALEPTTLIQNKSDLRAGVLALVEVCPAAECNPQDCPLYLLRKKKPAERMAWFNSLSGEDLAYLAAYHYVCLNIKLAQP